MKFLYAQGQVIALARFCKEEVYIAVMSTDDKDQQIRLPIKALGVERISSDKDVFGRELHCEPADSKSIWLEVKAHQAYLIQISL